MWHLHCLQTKCNLITTNSRATMFLHTTLASKNSRLFFVSYIYSGERWFLILSYAIWAISTKILCNDCGFEKNGQWSLPFILNTPSGGFSLTIFSWMSGERAWSSSVWMKNLRPAPYFSGDSDSFSMIGRNGMGLIETMAKATSWKKQCSIQDS